MSRTANHLLTPPFHVPLHHSLNTSDRKFISYKFAKITTYVFLLYWLKFVQNKVKPKEKPEIVLGFLCQISLKNVNV